MSDHKIESLYDWEWGYRAARGLLQDRLWVVIPVALVFVLTWDVFPYLTKEIAQIGVPISAFGDATLSLQACLQALVHTCMFVGLVDLCLKPLAIRPSWRTRFLAVIVTTALELSAQIVLVNAAQGIKSLEGSAPKLLAALVLFVVILAYVTYYFCLTAQILVDGKVNFNRARRSVGRREWRLLQTYFILIGLIYASALIQLGGEKLAEEVTQLQSYLPILESVLEALVWAVWTLGAAALSVVWFLNRRVRTTEESTTWDVPIMIPQS